MASEIQQQQQLAPQVQQPVFSPSFFTTLGVVGGILTMLTVAVARTLPNYLDRYFQLREASIRARMEADIREHDSDLKRTDSTHGTLNDFTRTLLANQLQTSRQIQEEMASTLQNQGQQLVLLMQMIQDSARNQSKFFDLADQIKASLADLKLEIEKNRKAINDKSE